MSRRNIAFVVAYDGTDFHGSQRQKNGRSIQGELESALARVTKIETPVLLAGRTDAGVHATGQVGRFSTEIGIPAEKVPLALNAHLPRAVRVLAAREAEDDWHPRFSASSRVYRYRIENATIANPLQSRFAGTVREPLNVEAMREASAAFLGELDFAAWQSAGSPLGGTVRRVLALDVQRKEGAFGDLIEVEIEANAFLYQMVRNIVGALIEVGRGKITRAEIEVLMAGRDRTKCPAPAPPQGLCLVEVKYQGKSWPH